MENFLKDIQEYLQEQAAAIKKTFVPVYLMLIFYFSPIFFRLSMDEGAFLIYQANEYNNFTGLGRPLIYFINSLFSFNNEIRYNETLVMFNAFALLSVTMILLYNRVNSNYKNNFLTYIIICSPCFSPFLFTSINYRFPYFNYHCAVMFLSITAACINSKNSNFNIFLKTVLLVLAHCTYQISLNIYIVSCLTIFLLDYLKQGKISKGFIFESISSLLLSALLYKGLILNNIKLWEIVNYRLQMFPLDQHFLTNSWAKLTGTLKVLLYPFSDFTGAAIAIFFIFGLFIFIFVAIKKLGNKLQATCITLSTIVLIIFFQSGFSTFFPNHQTYLSKYLNAFALVTFLVFFATNYVLENYLPKIKFLLPIIFIYLLSNTHNALSISNLNISYREKIFDATIQRLLKLNPLRKTIYERCGSFHLPSYKKKDLKSHHLKTLLRDDYFGLRNYDFIFSPPNLNFRYTGCKHINPKQFTIIEKNTMYAIAQKENHFLLIAPDHTYYRKIKSANHPQNHGA